MPKPPPLIDISAFRPSEARLSEELERALADAGAHGTGTVMIDPQTGEAKHVPFKEVFAAPETKKPADRE
jgi:hypothetical protein